MSLSFEASMGWCAGLTVLYITIFIIWVGSRHRIWGLPIGGLLVGVVHFWRSLPLPQDVSVVVPFAITTILFGMSGVIVGLVTLWLRIFYSLRARRLSRNSA